MRKYKHLTPEMRKEVKKLLDKGEKTPEEIRTHINEMYFVEHQNEFIAWSMVNDKIREVNEKFGTHIESVPLPIEDKVAEAFVGWDTFRVYEDSLDGELRYFVDRWEMRQKEKKI